MGVYMNLAFWGKRNCFCPFQYGTDYVVVQHVSAVHLNVPCTIRTASLDTCRTLVCNQNVSRE